MSCIVGPMRATCKRQRSGKRIIKLLSVLVGLACFGFTFVAKNLPTVVDAALTIHSIFAGPIFGVFTLGIFIPFASKRGATIAFVVSFAIMCFIGFGQVVAQNVGTYGSTLGDKPAVNRKPLSKENCPASWGLEGRLLSTSPASSGGDADDAGGSSFPHNAAFDIYYFWYTFMGFVITMVIGTLVSWCFPQDVHTLDPLMVSHEIPGVVKALSPKFTGLGEKCEIYYKGIGSIHREKLELAADPENENDASPQVKNKEDQTVDI